MRGGTIEWVLSSNGSVYKSHLWRQTCQRRGITLKKIRLGQPQGNGKIERFHKTMT
jgi:integrase family protein